MKIIIRERVDRTEKNMVDLERPSVVSLNDNRESFDFINQEESEP